MNAWWLFRTIPGACERVISVHPAGSVPYVAGNVRGSAFDPNTIDKSTKAELVRISALERGRRHAVVITYYTQEAEQVRRVLYSWNRWEGPEKAR